LVKSEAAHATTVLDVGCGIGNFLDWARRHGLRGIGVDVDAAAVAEARRRGLAAALPDDLDALIGDDRTVDVLTLWDVIEHVFDPHAFLAEFLRRAAPNGLLLLETPDAAFPVRYLLRGLYRISGGRVNLVGEMYYWEHKIYFTEEGLRRLLAAHNCEVLAVQRMTSPRAKTQRGFGYELEQAPSWHTRLLVRGWPIAESFFRRLGRGNKLIMLARRQSDPRVDQELASS
jgi:2-polyprenyl-3-methyl-5-hydroxy-6-metoxy-1,4-benzoquinol methylase